jgi:PIN domain nuclease of toxin-antitoxin system
MRVLLDTNVAIWLVDAPETLRSGVMEQLASDATSLVVSTVVPWEVAIKWRTGRLTLPDPPRTWSARMIREFGAVVLPVTFDHATQVADLPDHHRDPFDRLLIAQAQIEGMPIVTADRSFGAYDVEVIAAQ